MYFEESILEEAQEKINLKEMYKDVEYYPKEDF